MSKEFKRFSNATDVNAFALGSLGESVPDLSDEIRGAAFSEGPHDAWMASILLLIAAASGLPQYASGRSADLSVRGAALGTRGDAAGVATSTVPEFVFFDRNRTSWPAEIPIDS